jgi:hypothetical protein
MTGILGAFVPGFYAKIARQSLGRTIGFLLVLVLAISAVISLKDALMITPRLKYVQAWAEENLKKIPAIEVKDGVLVKPEKTYVLELGNDLPVFAVEPDLKNQADILAKYQNLVMLTRTQLVFKQTGEDSVSEEKRRELDKSSNWKITPNDSGFELAFDKNRLLVTPDAVAKWLKAAGILIFPVFLLIMVFVYSFTKLLQVMLFSLVGLAANAILKTGSAYQEIFNICSYALVPSTAMAVLAELLRLRLPGFWFLFCGVYILYIFLGLQASKTDEKPINQELS